MSFVVVIYALGPALLANGSPAAGGQTRHPPDFCTPQSCGIEPAHDLSPAESRVATGVFAACMVKRHPDQVRAWLDMPVFDRKTKAWMKALPGSRCVAQANVGMLAMDPLLLRGAFFGAFYARDFGSAAVAGTLSSNKPSYPIAVAAGAGKKPDHMAQIYTRLMTVGECAVRADPMAARDLTLSKPNSNAEQAEVQKIAALIPHCTDQSMSLSRPILRTMIAEPLYRLSTLDTASAPATGKQSS